MISRAIQIVYPSGLIDPQEVRLSRFNQTWGLSLSSFWESGSGIYQGFVVSRASLVAKTVKNLPAMQETWVQSLS